MLTNGQQNLAFAGSIAHWVKVGEDGEYFRVVHDLFNVQARSDDQVFPGVAATQSLQLDETRGVPAFDVEDEAVVRHFLRGFDQILQIFLLELKTMAQLNEDAALAELPERILILVSQVFSR